MHGELRPESIAVAAVLAQAALALVVFAGILIFRPGEYRNLARGVASTGFLLGTTVAASIISIVLLLLSNELSALWRPLISGRQLASIDSAVAIILMFVIDIVWVCLLVCGTGGSMSSPFAPMFFIVPALAIFLREPVGHTLIYVGMVAVGFSLGLILYNLDGLEVGTRRRPVAYWFVSVACFALTTVVGLATAPR